MADGKTYTLAPASKRMIIGIPCRTSNAQTAKTFDIAFHWTRFLRDNIVTQIPNRVSDTIVAVYTDYETDHNSKYTLILGCFVTLIDTIPKDMVSKHISESTYATFTARGELPKDIFNCWKTIWSTPLNRSYREDYELYESSKVTIHIGVKDS